MRTVLIEFIKYKELADKVKNSLKGAVIKSNKKPPFMFEVMSPSLNASISWYLERGEGKFLPEIATAGSLNFKAEPLLGAAFTIDLLAVISNVHPVVKAFIIAIEVTLEAAQGGMTIEAKFKGEFSFDFKALTFNSKKGGLKGGTLDLGAKLTIEIIAIIKISISMRSLCVKPLIQISAEGKFNSYFAAKLTIDTEEKKGLFAQPSLEFSGMIFKFKVTVVIRGFKAVRKFGNEKEPFLKAELNNLPKFYLT